MFRRFQLSDDLDLEFRAEALKFHQHTEVRQSDPGCEKCRLEFVPADHPDEQGQLSALVALRAEADVLDRIGIRLSGISRGFGSFETLECGGASLRFAGSISVPAFSAADRQLNSAKAEALLPHSKGRDHHSRVRPQIPKFEVDLLAPPLHLDFKDSQDVEGWSMMTCRSVYWYHGYDPEEIHINAEPHTPVVLRRVEE